MIDSLGTKNRETMIWSLLESHTSYKVLSFHLTVLVDGNKSTPALILTMCLKSTEFIFFVIGRGPSWTPREDCEGNRVKWLDFSFLKWFEFSFLPPLHKPQGKFRVCSSRVSSVIEFIRPGGNNLTVGPWPWLGHLSHPVHDSLQS